MKDILKKYEKKNKITGIIALILLCIALIKVTNGISIILLVFLTINEIRENKYIRIKKEEIRKKHDAINKEE